MISLYLFPFIERYRAITSAYYRGAVGFEYIYIFIYSAIPKCSNLFLFSLINPVILIDVY